MRQSKRNRIVFIVIVISIIVALGIIGLFKSGAMIQKDYKKSVRYKKLKYLSYKLEDLSLIHISAELFLEREQSVQLFILQEKKQVCMI